LAGSIFLIAVLLNSLVGQNLSSAANQAFNKSQYSIYDPTSIWVIVNKSRPLNPLNYVPPDLVVPYVKLQLSPKSERMHVRQIIAGPLQDLFAAAVKDGFHLILLSGYRSEAYQEKIYARYEKKLRRASIASAKPGYSEHQTGLAVDLNRDKDLKCLAMPCFANMPEAKWLADHAHEFGFIIRYEKDKESVSGYEYEPWHLRYVGKELATELFNTHETMEEFFGITTSSANSANTNP
jgi:zinc D-Ala-D-Ala carboxypeptidase